MNFEDVEDHDGVYGCSMSESFDSNSNRRPFVLECLAFIEN